MLQIASVVGLGLVACFDLPTAPQLETHDLTRSNDFTQDPQWGRSSSPNSGSWDGEVDLWDGSTALGPAWSFPYKTIIVVSISGDVMQADGGYTGSGIVWGPLGRSNINGRAGMIGYRLGSATGSSMIWPIRVVDTVVVQNDMQPVRAAVDGAQPNQYPNPFSCGTYNNQTPRWACYSYPGTAHLEFSRPQVDLTLSPSAAETEVVRGATMTFTAGLSIATIKGIAVDLSALSWRWIPDMASGDSATANSACTSAVGRSCTMTIETSGTLFVSAYVNGQHQQKSAHVTVNPAPPRSCLDVPEFVTRFPELANSYMDTIATRLWQESKYSPDTLNTNRRERGGYILRDPSTGGYSFQQFEISGPCHTQSADSLNVPLTIVAEIHTHPFKTGESYSGCGPGYNDLKFPDGRWQRYKRAPSGDSESGDYGALAAISQKSGRPVKGYILDFDGVITYDPSNLDPNSPHPGGETWGRCSY